MQVTSNGGLSMDVECDYADADHASFGGDRARLCVCPIGSTEKIEPKTLLIYVMIINAGVQ